MKLLPVWSLQEYVILNNIAAVNFFILYFQEKKKTQNILGKENLLIMKLQFKS